MHNTVNKVRASHRESVQDFVPSLRIFNLIIQQKMSREHNLKFMLHQQ